MSLNQADREYIASIGIPMERVQEQLEAFRRGFSFIDLERSCILGDGIRAVDEHEIADLAAMHDAAVSQGRIMKFIPASGAATRMFKSLMAVQYDHHIRQDPNHPDNRYLKTFIDNLPRFAFYEDLKSAMALRGLDLEALLQTGQYSDILSYLLNEIGLNYAHLPKALLKFHRYESSARTPLEEHIAEATHYALDSHNRARLHFTVSSEHLELIEEFVDRIRPNYERDGIGLDISFSVQKPSTNTIAVDLENNPFRDKDGQIVFRPAGHGALLENLNDLKCDIVFIKNIDNVVPDRLKPTTYQSKKILSGCLIKLQDRIFEFLRDLDASGISEDKIASIQSWIEEHLEITMDAEGSGDAVADNLRQALNRPIRVCGMVRNQGEPGGGPFWVNGQDGQISKQIVEKSQIDLSWPKQRLILEDSTHFNPVDLVCGVRDYLGRPFDLHKFTDPATGFISKKSRDGRELKAIELPGLWNGQMANWITAFVEIPLITFNPVKTVNDLLRPEHQP